MRYCLAEVLLEYLLDRDLGEQLRRGTDYIPPPPYDRSSWFPVVAFDSGDMPHLGVFGEVVDPAVVQIVPTPCNRYAGFYGFGPCGTWVTVTEVSRHVGLWIGLGQEVQVHRRWRGVRAVGCGSGFRRFLIGGGISLYIVRELGPLPRKMKVQGETLERYAAVLGYQVPGFSRGPPVCHLVPREFLEDPPLPGLPETVDVTERLHWTPPPPLFRAVDVYWPGSGYRYAVVVVGLSGQERLEGGRIVSGLVIRGLSYSVLNGFRVIPALKLPVSG